MNTQNGFTLVEVILYMGLFGILLGGIIVSMYPILSNTDHLTERVLTEGEVVFITQKIRASLYHYVTDEEVVIEAPRESSSGDTLVIERESNELLRIEEDDSLTHCTPPHLCSMLLWSENGNTPLPLSNERVRIDNFIVYHGAPTPNSKRFLDISFTANNIPIGPIRYYLNF